MALRAAFVYEDALTRVDLRDDHPLVPSRLRYTYELLEAYQAFDGDRSAVMPPRQATEEEVLGFHQRDYVEAVKSLSHGERKYNPSRFNLSAGRGDTPVFPGMYEASLWSTGASLTAAALVADGEASVASNFAGGLHHAMPDHASGFCVFNDPVIAIQHLRNWGLRVAYVDIDAHHGDGVQHAFFDTSQVLTISLHESGSYLFPGTGFVEEMGTGEGRGYAVNVPLLPYTGDEAYLWAFRQVVPSLVRAFKPDVLVTQLGIDTHYLDPLTHLCLTSAGYTEAVKELAALGLPWVALGGGGYDVSAVIRCWSLAYGVMSGRDWPDEIPAAYQERYGLQRLRDADGPRVEESVCREAQHFAQQSVSQVQRLIFPIHGL
ncbi:MAG: acetoin utilization protein AcuC [Dehalococcoidia bacterium]